jgi:hypothetical protein
MIELILSFLLGFGAPSIHAQFRPITPSLDGHERDGIYTNDRFRFAFKLPEGWESVPESTQAAILKDLNAKASNADNRALIMLWRRVQGESMPDVIAVFSARYSGSGLNGAEGGVAYFKALPSHDTVITPVGIVELGGQRFASQVLQLRGQADFMAHFASVNTGYLLSFQAHAATQDRLNEVVKILSASVQFR